MISSARFSGRILTTIALLAMLGTLVVGLADSAAQPKPPASAAARADGGAPAPPKPQAGAAAHPLIPKLRERTQRIRDLLAETLDLGVEPASLFDVSLEDARAIEVEAWRLSTILERVDRRSEPPDAGSPDAAVTDGGGAVTDGGGAATDAAAEAVDGGSDAGVAAAADEYDELRRSEPALFDARIALDRAQLDFYRLPEAARQELLQDHADRVKTAEDSKAAAAQRLNEAERKAEQAELDQQRALEAAKRARSEAARLVSEEYARLLGIAKEQADFEVDLLSRRKVLGERAEAVLGWQRKVAETVSKREAGQLDHATIDSLYVDLRATLRASRGELSAALDVLSSGETGVKTAGADPLQNLPAEVDRSQVEAEREQLQQNAAKLRAEEDDLRHARAQTLLNEVEVLNRLRLDLLPHLSTKKRSDITSFDTAGRDQAGAEVTQVLLVLRYHLSATSKWVTAIRQPGDQRGQSAWTATLVALRWLIPIVAFIWWRRRADGTLQGWRSRGHEADSKQRGRSMGPGWRERALSFVLRIRRPLEWLLLTLAVVWLLPDRLESLLEVELFETVLVWTFSGMLVVAVIDALASEEVRGTRRARSKAYKTADIRLRSLRLIGQTTVAFGLILALSDRLVGKGTIYSWVLSTCWFAAIPILLIIVRWWQPVIFERVDLVRKKGALLSWVLARRGGAMGFVAAIVGGAYLLGSGLWRALRSWVVTFTVTRRLLAYLFQRDMTKKDQVASRSYEPLAEELFTLLGPETPSQDIVESVADAQVEQVIERIRAPGGGVFAIVGERGAGKTTLINRIAATAEELIRIDAPSGGLAELQATLADAFELEPDASLAAAIGERLDALSEDSALLLDNAQHLLSPMMGGLRQFDKVLDLARQHSRRCTWIFAIDEVLWRFLERARGSRPLFDEVIKLKPWSEEGIARLLSSRNTAAGISPSFEQLLGDTEADDDRPEALQRTEASYYRLLWDYAAGNPGVALHFWRTSLGLDEEGTICVRTFRAPDVADLEQLPDSAVFVLRAIIQLGWAGYEDVCRATSLPAGEVRDALRYGAVKGYFEIEQNRYHVTWSWFRAVTRLLRRRHLIFSGT